MSKRVVRRWMPSVMMAIRAAVAAMAAWLAGNLLPGDMSDYAYAAPLGAFIATGSTVFTVARAAMQQTVGLAMGAALGVALLQLDIPAPVKIGIIGGVGVLAQAITRLGGGASSVPVAALLVIIFGGIDPDGYAIAYVGQFALGLAIGVVVNLIASPPLRDREAAEQIDDTAEDLARRFETVAEAMRGDWPPEDDSWSYWPPDLEARIDQLGEKVRVARESRRLNSRTLWHAHDISEDEEDLAALRAVVHRAIDVLDALSGAAWSMPVEVTLDDEALHLTADALDRLAAHLRAWPVQEGVAEASTALGGAIDALYRHVVARAEPESGALAIVYSLRAMRERIDRASSSLEKPEASAE